MYKKILVPLDGSQRAEAILPHVEQIAHCHDAQIVFLQVVEQEPVLVTPYNAQAYIPDQEALEERQAEIDAYLAGWEGEFRQKNIEAKRIVAHGPVVETITHVSDRENVDLVAMSSHGRGGLARVFYGSIAAGVLQRVSRPLLLIRAEQD